MQMMLGLLLHQQKTAALQGSCRPGLPNQLHKRRYSRYEGIKSGCRRLAW